VPPTRRAIVILAVRIAIRMGDKAIVQPIFESGVAFTRVS
jgi:hypothetical protein